MLLGCAGLNSGAARDLDGPACGEALVEIGAIASGLAAAQNALVRRFDAADAHDADGYATTAAWLAGKTGLGRKDAKAAVRQMRLMSRHPLLDDATAAGDITPECAAAVTAVLESLGKRRGPEDLRGAGQRFHDALQEGCELLPRVCYYLAAWFHSAPVLATSRCMPDDGLSLGNSVPSRRCRLPSVAALYMALLTSGMYLAGSRLLSETPSSRRRSLRAPSLSSHEPCGSKWRISQISKQGLEIASLMPFSVAC